MLSRIISIAALAYCASLAHAGEAGKVIYVAGKVQVVDRAAAEGASVQEGDLLQTGPDGFLYVKTIDNGLFILRPNTKARIVSYHVDANNPANTRVKLDLISGVARSRSGDAVKQARQNFRFNTPVAAIGVRGTDFTVSTDDNVSRVSVLSGGVVVSGFAGACSPEGTGPCEGSGSRELFAAQRGQLLQIQRGGAAPQLMNGAVVGPEHPLPADAPVAAGPGVRPGVGPAEPGVDVEKTRNLEQAVADKPDDQPKDPVVMPPPSVDPLPPKDPVVTPTPTPPDEVQRGIVWGRWQRVLGKAPKIDLTYQQGVSELFALNGNYALFRTPGKDYVAPERGTVGFSLKDSEAFIYNDAGSKRTSVSAALYNGKLNVDFGSRTFTTSISATTLTERFTLQGNGAISPDGGLHGNQANGQAGFMDVKGLLSNEGGGTAAYIFSSQIDANRTINGATYWKQ